jgi:DNA excision repair protein ERCC-2
MKPIFEKFRNVVLTSGTISPLDIYPKMLKFKPIVTKAFDIEMPANRNPISPIIVTKGVD